VVGVMEKQKQAFGEERIRRTTRRFFR